MHGGHLTPDNVRLAHRVCNQRDYLWRVRINAMLGKRMSLEEIAEQLNVKKVPTIHGTNRWNSCICSEGIRFLEAPALEDSDVSLHGAGREIHVGRSQRGQRVSSRSRPPAPKG
jgi:DNA-binding transcriptional MerR regulator